jgi:NitT/TauT family transport system ATP-binding protein
VLDALDMVELRASAEEYPWRLSGGMQQRVQIARALAMRPSVLLMDEPFGALDAMTKASLQDQLQRVHELTGTTVVFVTHDVEEAVYLSDRVLVLSGRPAGIGLDLDVALPRPRVQVTTKESPEYLQLRHQVYRALGHGTGH